MTFDLKKDGKRIIVICIASVIMAVNTKTFIRTGGLYPGGVMGLTILIQAIFENFFNIFLVSKSPISRGGGDNGVLILYIVKIAILVYVHLLRPTYNKGRGLLSIFYIYKNYLPYIHHHTYFDQHKQQNHLKSHNNIFVILNFCLFFCT